MMSHEPGAEELVLTPAEIPAMFRVDPKTVTRWAKAGKLTSIRTLGGHRRYRESEVRALLAGIPLQRDDEGYATIHEENSTPPDTLTHLSIYVQGDNDEVARRLIDAFRKVYASNDINMLADGPAIIGSWFQRFRLKFRRHYER